MDLRDASTCHARSGEDDLARLIVELRRRGINYLSGGDDPNVVAAVAVDPLPDVALMQCLANCGESRVRHALIGLLLLHPELAHALPQTMSGVDTATAERIATLALAAWYMQHLWRARLALALGFEPRLPAEVLEPLRANRGLPAAEEFQGEWGLRVLQERERKQLGAPLNVIGDWQNHVDHVLRQEWAARQREQAHEPAAAGR